MTLDELIRVMIGTLTDDEFFLKPTEEDVALLASMLPEERNDECFCDDLNLSWKWNARLRGWRSHTQVRRTGYCGRCGGELGPGNICRRNADTKRVEVLRQLLTTGNDRWPAPSVRIMGQTAGASMPMDEFRAAIDEVGARIEQGDQSP